MITFISGIFRFIENLVIAEVNLIISADLAQESTGSLKCVVEFDPQNFRSTIGLNYRNRDRITDYF